MDYPGTSILKSDHPLLASALAKRADVERGTKEQSYFDHVIQVYLAWRSLVAVHDSLIGRVAVQTGVSKLAILQSSLLCVALHDVGKLSENFQRMIRATTDEQYRRMVALNYRHEVIPLCLVRALAMLLGARTEDSLPGMGLLETMAVAGHHKYLADGYLRDSAKYKNEIVWADPCQLRDALPAAVKFCSVMFQEQGWKAPAIRDKETLRAIFATLKDRTAAWVYLNDRFDDMAHIRSQTNLNSLRHLFTLLKGLLMTADWMASGTNDSHYFLDANKDVVQVPRSKIRQYVTERVAGRGGVFSGFRPFQEQCGNTDGHVLAVAPTGSGKTEAAMLWGLRQIESGAVKKLLFLMPTMVTANSLHRRMTDFFDKQHGHRVSLVHSTADLIRMGDVSAENDGTDGHSRSDAFGLRDPHLFAPVTVGTVDQLLVTLMHSGRWAIKTLAAANAAIVIDELHAYDPHTAGLLMLMLTQFSRMGTRFMVMSATMPSDLRRAVTNALEPQTLTTIEDQSLLQASRNTWETNRVALTAWLGMKDGTPAGVSERFRVLSQLFNHEAKPSRILIVVNTVKRCQEIARHLQEFDPICYHSKFTFGDRRKKESEIEDKRPQLLIATQVVEVSLDIDYDILLTECAPIDALIQRAGRVNRPRRTTPGRVVVFSPEAGSDKIYGEPNGVLQSTWDAIEADSGNQFTEQQLLDLVESVYAGKDLAKHHSFLRIQRATEGIQDQLSGVLDSPRPYETDTLLKTRLENYAQQTAIPEKFATLCENASHMTRRKYELKVPLWYFQKFKIRDAAEDLPLCAMEYDEVYGAQLHTSSTCPDPGNFIF
ncbi:MAG: CRISPR-associated helicase Cas3' [Planctomycetaceae bacterium]